MNLLYGTKQKNCHINLMRSNPLTGSALFLALGLTVLIVFFLLFLDIGNLYASHA